MATNADKNPKNDMRTPLQRDVDSLFDKYHLSDIIDTLAARCDAEANISHGEGQFDPPGENTDWHKWNHVASELRGVDTSHFTDPLYTPEPIDRE